MNINIPINENVHKTVEDIKNIISYNLLISKHNKQLNKKLKKL